MNRILYLTIIAVAFLLASCGSTTPTTPPKAPPVPIAVYQVQQENATYYDEYPATITALNEVEIRPQVSGYITGIHFTDGQYVRKGMKLYSIDQQQYRAGYDQSIANLNVAKANLARAQQDADRYLDLAKKDAIAKQVVDHSLAELQAVKMQVAAAQANVRSVQTGLRYSTIYAPLSGTIGISQVKMGAAVTPGVTVLNTISSDDPVAVDFAVDEKSINRFIQLQQAGKNSNDSTFRIVLPDGTVFPNFGRIAFLDRAVDPQTGTIKARLVFPNKNKVLKPGMSCIVKVQNNGSQQQLLIPYKAVVEQMGEYFVYVLKDTTVSQRKISLGTRISERVIVKDGLQAGEQVATEGVQKLKEGATVQVGGSTADKATGTAPSAK